MGADAPETVPVIDAHAHVLTSRHLLSDQFLATMSRHKRLQLGEAGFSRYQTALADPTFGSVEHLLRDMDDAGIDVSVIFPSGPFHHDFPDHTYDPDAEVWAANEYVADAQRRHPGRIIGFVKPDLLSKTAVKLIEVGIRDWGLRGVKLHPAGAPIDADVFRATLDAVAEMGVPVLVHLGVDPIPFLAKNGNPEALETLSVRYPQMRILGAHHARGYGELLTAIITNREGRVFSDLSLWQVPYVDSRWSFQLRLRELLDLIPGALLMGSDWPWVAAKLSQRAWFDAIRNLTLPPAALDLGMPQVSPAEKAALLGGNALRWLGAAAADVRPLAGALRDRA